MYQRIEFIAAPAGTGACGAGARYYLSFTFRLFFLFFAFSESEVTNEVAL